MVLRVRDGGGVLPSLFQMFRGVGMVRETEGAGEGLVGVAEVERGEVVLLADLPATVGVIERGLGTFQHGINPGYLPLADAEVGGISREAPVITGGVRAVDQGVCLGGSAVGFFHESPRLVEEVHGEATVGFGSDGSGHEHEAKFMGRSSKQKVRDPGRRIWELDLKSAGDSVTRAHEDPRAHPVSVVSN